MGKVSKLLKNAVARTFFSRPGRLSRHTGLKFDAQLSYLTLCWISVPEPDTVSVPDPIRIYVPVPISDSVPILGPVLVSDPVFVYFLFNFLFLLLYYYVFPLSLTISRLCHC